VFVADPEKEGRAKALKNYRLINVPDAGTGCITIN